MAAPRIPIPDLPDKPTASAGDLLIVQDGPTTKKMTMQHLYDGSGITAHINNTTAAHDATAITAASNGPGQDAATVHGQLGQIKTATNSANTTALAASDAVNAHISDPVDAHDASAISVVNGLGVTSNNVQAGLFEIVGRVINTTPPLSGGGNLQADRTLSISTFSTSTPGVAPASPGGTTNFLRADGNWAIPPGGGGGGGGTLIDNNYGDVTVHSGGTGMTINGDVVTNAKLADAPALTLKGNNAGTATNPVDLSATQAKTLLAITQTDVAGLGTALTAKADKAITISTAAPLAGGGDLSANRTLTITDFTAGARGTVPPSGGGTVNFLRADGSWQAPPVGSSGTGAIVQQPNPPADTTVIWADTDEVGIEENVRYLSNVLTTTYTLTLADKGKMILCTNTSPQTVTVPPNSSVAFLIGTQLDLVQMGSGVLTIAQGSGVTVSATPSRAFRAQYSGASLIKISTDGWLLLGDLA